MNQQTDTQVKSRQQSGCAYGVIALMLLAAMHPVRADSTPQWLFDVSVPVASQRADDQAEAAQDAMLEMLGRLTGRADTRELSAYPVLEDALANPQRYYAQSGFEQRRTPSGVQLLLRVVFIPSAMQALVREAGLPLWGSRRPHIATWLVEDGQLLTAEPDQDTPPDVEAIARRYGVPLVVPPMATEVATEAANQRDAAEAAVNRLDFTALQDYSRALQADMQLLGRIRVDASSASGEFSLGRLGAGASVQPQQFRIRRESAEALYQALAIRIAREQIAQFAVSGNRAGSVRLAVVGLEGVADYAAMLKFLSTLEAIESMAVTRLTGEALELTVLTRASEHQLFTLLTADGRFRVEDSQLQATLRWMGAAG